MVRVYVNGQEQWRDTFAEKLAERCSALEVDPIAIQERDPTPWPERGVVLYLSNGLQDTSEEVETELNEHRRLERTVIPVVRSIAGADRQLPPLLAGLNAFGLDQHSGDWAVALVDEVLSHLWLHRRLKKIFLSYKRSDSLAVAQQLHERFTKLGYQVFLDECSIEPGADIRQALRWWLNDTDLVLVLASPNLPNSSWVLEEIEFANLSSIGLVAVTWPNAEPAPVHAVTSDQRLALVDTDFDQISLPLHEQRLKDDAAITGNAVGRIVAMVQKERAVLVMRRMQALMPYVHAAADGTFEVQSTDLLSDLSLKRPGRIDQFHVRVFPFRPTAEALHELKSDLGRQSPVPVGTACVYLENEPNDSRARALRWLTEEKRQSEQPSRYHLLTAVPLELSVLK
jgi:hypothetical protein